MHRNNTHHHNNTHHDNNTPQRQHAPTTHHHHNKTPQQQDAPLSSSTLTTIGAPSDAAASAVPGIAGDRGPVVRFELLEMLVTTSGGAGAVGAGGGGADCAGGAGGAAGEVCSPLSRIFLRSRCFLRRTAETIHSSKSAAARGECGHGGRAGWWRGSGGQHR